MLLYNTLKKANIFNFLFIVFASCCLGSMIIVYDIRAVALVGLMTFVLIALTRKEYAFCFLLASRSIIDAFYYIEAAGGVRATHFMGALVGIIFIFYVLVEKHNIFRIDVNKYYLSFMFLSIIPIFLTKNIFEGFVDWFKILQGFFILNMAILIVLSAGNDYKKRMNIICWSMIIALLLPSVLFLKNYVQGVHVVMGGIDRYSTFGSYVNNFSYYLLAVFPICLFFYSMSIKKPEKIFWLVLMAILLFFIYKTYTRNVWMGVTILIFVWNLIRKNFKFTFSFLGMFIFIVIYDASVQDRFKDMHEIFSGKSFYDLDPKLLSQRIGVWQSNIHWFLSNSTIIEKLFGNGFDIKLKVPNLNPYSNNPIEAHNNYLTLLMTTGIFGLVTYNLFIFKLFQESFKLLRRTKDIYFKNLAQIFVSVLSTYVIVCFFTHMIWKVNFHYFFSALAGLVIAANILEEKNAS